ncbi:MAG: hypothetical protein JRJ85_17855, partial [Deltaproteobacteria bacterium]|nr:hypothetical protein [Deltaproteobacteria bacterium]
YADHINRQLASPDHLELNLISADFMRLDILEWGLEELGGDDEVRQMHNSIRTFAARSWRKSMLLSVISFAAGKCSPVSMSPTCSYTWMS